MINPTYIATSVNGVFANEKGEINLTQQAKIKPFEEFFDNFTGDTLNVKYIPIDKVEIFADGVKLYEGVDRDFTIVGVDVYFNYVLKNKNIGINYGTKNI
ncbi:MAG: hypothetical protein KBD28_03560 [Chitinophagaceae bacterium]|nr:hypothetical protein [Chitinophagaceae bacterium]